MVRLASILLLASLGGSALTACRCNTETPGSSAANPSPPPAEPPVVMDAPFVPPRLGAPRLPGARVSPRIFQNLELPDAAVTDGN